MPFGNVPDEISGLMLVDSVQIYIGTQPPLCKLVYWMFLVVVCWTVQSHILLVQVLKVFQYPITITSLQFAVGTALVLVMWATNLHKKPKISSSQVCLLYCVDGFQKLKSDILSRV